MECVVFAIVVPYDDLIFDTFSSRWSQHTGHNGGSKGRADCIVYDRLSLRSSAHVPLAAAAAARVLGLRRHRGCRAGRRFRRSVPRLRPTGNGAYVVTGNRTKPSRRRSVSGSDRPNVVPIRPLRHTETTSRAIVFGSMKVKVWTLAIAPLK